MEEMTTEIVCPVCDTSVKVRYRQSDYECPKCTTLTLTMEYSSVE